LTADTDGANVGSVRLWLAGLIVGLATMAAVGSPAATSARSNTQMYRGHTYVGDIEAQSARHWTIDCEAVTGDEVFMGARRRALWVRHWNGSLDAYAVMQDSGRWAIRYAGTRSEVAFALRRSSTRWDILQGRRTLGHTIGPDGPAAAAALLSAC
jgi:hypothetical protein